MSDPSDSPERPSASRPPASQPPDWEAFYRSYRKPGYVAGFEITTKLGGGAFGLVFKARKESIGKDYAIKFLQVDDLEVREAVFRELDQVQYFAQIDHPNLVQIEDRGEVDGIPFLVMQYAGSETLRDRVPVDGLPTASEREELLHLFVQACRGVAALHERSLVHFDIKPANVFLKGGMARVGDYGLSKLVTHSRGSLSMGRGTPYYMAPEILQRRGDHRSDIYSLGVLLYELLTGVVPFRGDSEWEVLQKHENATPDWPGELLPQHRRALEQCLAKDPNARFTRVEELVAALGVAVDATRVVPASPVSTAAPIASSTHAAAGRQQPPPLPSRRPSAVPPPLPSARSEVAWVKAPAELQPPPLPAAQSGALDAPPPPPSGVASSATPGELVPPPLPRSGRRRGSWALALVPSVLVLFAIFLFVGQSGDRSRREGRRAAARTHAQQRAVAGPTSIRERVDRFVKSAQRRMKSASQGRRRTTMKDLRLDRVDAPRNLRNYIDMVERLAEAPRFSSGHATKLALHGRPIFLAAVARLQQLDYRDGDDCRAAAHMTSLLAQITGLTGLRVSWDGCDPSRSEISRFQTNADAWRRLAEEFAKNDRDYTRLVAVKGRGRG